MRAAPGSEPAQTVDRPYRLEQVDDAAVVQLYADGFSELTLRDRLLVWHLYQAALAGRDIYYDQRHRDNLAIRHLLEELGYAIATPDEAREMLALKGAANVAF